MLRLFHVVVVVVVAVCLSVGFVVVVALLVESSTARAMTAMKHVANPRLMKSLSTR